MLKNIIQTIKAEQEFKDFLKKEMTPKNYRALKKFCKMGMRQYFGFYENLEVSFSPQYDHPNNYADLTIEQGNAFKEAFQALKNAPPPILETIRQFCHC